jgi:hypothetical protein
MLEARTADALRIAIASVAAIAVSSCATVEPRQDWVRATPVNSPAAPLSAVDGFYGDAVAAIDRRDYGRALDLLQLARQHKADDVRVLNALGVVYDKLGRFDLSARYYAQAATSDPASSIVQSNIAYSERLREQGSRGEAQLAAAPILKVAPAPVATPKAPVQQAAAAPILSTAKLPRKLLATSAATIPTPVSLVRTTPPVASIRLTSFAPLPAPQREVNPPALPRLMASQRLEQVEPPRRIVAREAPVAPMERLRTLLASLPQFGLGAAAETAPTPVRSAVAKPLAASPAAIVVAASQPPAATAAQPVRPAPVKPLPALSAVHTAQVADAVSRRAGPSGPVRIVAFAPRMTVAADEPRPVPAAAPQPLRLAAAQPLPAPLTASPAAAVSRRAGPTGPVRLVAFSPRVTSTPDVAERAAAAVPQPVPPVRQARPLQLARAEAPARAAAAGKAPSSAPVARTAAAAPSAPFRIATAPPPRALITSGAPVPLRQYAAAATPGVRPPLRIVNASGEIRRAEPIRSSLASLGWSAPRWAVMDTRVQARSVIYYPASRLAVARALASTLPGSTRLVVCNNRCAGLQLVLGADARGWKPMRRRSRFA